LATPRTPYNIASALSISYIIYLIGVAIHRLYFSRYAKFPGPKLARLTYAYMFYYDVIAGKGEYIYKIKELHEKYGKHMLFLSFGYQKSAIVGSVSLSPIT
jgi:hypothetical protein